MENLSLLCVLRRTQADSPASNEARTHMYVSLQESAQSRPASLGREAQWEGILITHSLPAPHSW